MPYEPSPTANFDGEPELDVETSIVGEKTDRELVIAKNRQKLIELVRAGLVVAIISTNTRAGDISGANMFMFVDFVPGDTTRAQAFFTDGAEVWGTEMITMLASAKEGFENLCTKGYQSEPVGGGKIRMMELALADIPFVSSASETNRPGLLKSAVDNPEIGVTAGEVLGKIVEAGKQKVANAKAATAAITSALSGLS